MKTPYARARRVLWTVSAAVLLALVVTFTAVFVWQRVLRQKEAARLVVRAAGSLRAGDIAAAIDDYTRAAAVEPGFVEAYMGRGAAYARAGRHDLAIADFTKATGLRPNMAEAYSERAFSRARQGDYAAAVSDLTHAIALAPRDARLYNNRGWTRVILGNYADALLDLDRAVSMEPTAQRIDSRGWARMLSGEMAKAAEDFRDAIALEPGRSSARALQFRILASQGKAAEARAVAEEALSTMPPGDDMRPIFEYYLGGKTLEELKSAYRDAWPDYEVNIRAYTPAASAPPVAPVTPPPAPRTTL